MHIVAEIQNQPSELFDGCVKGHSADITDID